MLDEKVRVCKRDHFCLDNLHITKILALFTTLVVAMSTQRDDSWK